MQPENKEIPSQKPEDSQQKQAPQPIPEAEMKILKHISHKTAEHMQEAKRNLTAQIMGGVSGLLAWAGFRLWVKNRLFEFDAAVVKETADNFSKSRSTLMDAGGVSSLGSDGAHSGGILREASEYKKMLGDKAYNALEVSEKDRKLANTMRRVGGRGAVSVAFGVVTGIATWAAAKALLPRKEPEPVDVQFVVPIHAPGHEGHEIGKHWQQHVKESRKPTPEQGKEAAVASL
jgi:hypothetical protein